MRPTIWMATSLTALLATAAVAQQKVDDRYPFRPGDIVGFGPNAYPPGATYRVTNCDPVDKRFRECRMIRRAPQAETHERPFVMENYSDRLELIGHEGEPAPARAGATPRVAAAAPGGGACPRSAYGGPVPGSRPASPALFQQKITDSITMAAYGPYWYGVRLSDFQVGAPITNRVSVQPGVGAVRVNTGAPPNATMYPVSTTMSVCEGAPAGSSSWRTSRKKYLCFVSASKEWTCGASN